MLIPCEIVQYIIVSIRYPTQPCLQEVAYFEVTMSQRCLKHQRMAKQINGSHVCSRM